MLLGTGKWAPGSAQRPEPLRSFKLTWTKYICEHQFKMIDFNSLILERLAFEVRYKGPLYLDRCGLVWREFEARFPEASSGAIAPDGANFQLKERATVVKFGSSSMSVVEDYPTSLASLSEIADFLVPVIVKTFDVDVFERVGVRFIFLLPVKERRDADELVLSSRIFNLPDQKVKLFGTKPSEIGVRFGIESEDQGYTFNLVSASREVQGNVPRPIKVDYGNFPKNILIVDIDRFTRKPVGVGTVSASDLIRTTQKTISNNISALLRGEGK
jgi:hypothetical protein